MTALGLQATALALVAARRGGGLHIEVALALLAILALSGLVWLAWYGARSASDAWGRFREERAAERRHAAALAARRAAEAALTPQQRAIRNTVAQWIKEEIHPLMEAATADGVVTDEEHTALRAKVEEIKARAKAELDTEIDLPVRQDASYQRAPHRLTALPVTQPQPQRHPNAATHVPAPERGGLRGKVHRGGRRSVVLTADQCDNRAAPGGEAHPRAAGDWRAARAHAAFALVCAGASSYTVPPMHTAVSEPTASSSRSSKRYSKPAPRNTRSSTPSRTTGCARPCLSTRSPLSVPVSVASVAPCCRRYRTNLVCCLVVMVVCLGYPPTARSMSRVPFHPA